MTSIIDSIVDATALPDASARDVSSHPAHTVATPPTTSKHVSKTDSATAYVTSTPPAGFNDSSPAVSPDQDIKTTARKDNTDTPAHLQADSSSTENTTIEEGTHASFSPPAGFADLLASACYAQFARLPRRARPQAGREWALLAGVLLTEPPHTQPVVAALGSGSKCLGASQLSRSGDKVADSHAEVIARRAFRRFLMAEVRRVFIGEEQSRWLVKGEGGAELRAGVRVHFFTSHTPCGDCSIFPRERGEEEEGGAEPAMKRPRRDAGRAAYSSQDRDETSAEDSADASQAAYTPSPTDAADIYRTGAKPVVGEAADPLRAGAEYHVTGVLRSKPGRGQRTLSLSCSDKLARWLRLGLQGALLSCWLPRPLLLSSVVTGPAPYSAEAMQRALLSRPALLATPLLAQADVEFEFSRRVVERDAGESAKVVPSPCSVVWSRGCARELEVSVEGIRQGVTKKARGTAAARVAICRREVMQEFVELARDVATEQLPAGLRDAGNRLGSLTYREVKDLAGGYVSRWRGLRQNVFQNWTEKPSHLMDFRVTTGVSGTGDEVETNMPILADV